MQIFPTSWILSGAILQSSLVPPASVYTEAYIEQSSVDQEISIVFRGPEPGEEIRITAQLLDENGLLWTSLGLFQCDEFGVIDLNLNIEMDK